MNKDEEFKNNPDNNNNGWCIIQETLIFILDELVAYVQELYDVYD